MMQQQQQPYKYSLDSVGMNAFSILEEENTNVDYRYYKRKYAGEINSWMGLERF